MKHSTFCFRNVTRRALHLSVALLLTVLLASCGTPTPDIRFGSGNQGGLYDKYAIKFADSFSKETDPFIIIKTTSGSAANIRLMEEGFLDLAIVQNDLLQEYQKRNRTRHPISAVAGLYTEFIQIVVSEDSDIRSVADLQGHKVSVGEEESGVVRNAEIILESYGISFDKIQKEHLGFKKSAKALIDGEIDAFFCTAGIPTPSIQKLVEDKKIRILALDSATVQRITNLHPEFSSNTIPAGTYAGQDSAAQTLGTKAILVASLLVDSTTIQKFTKVVLQDSSIPMDYATENIPVGFHPGASAYYKSKGYTVETAAPLQGRGPIPSTGD